MKEYLNNRNVTLFFIAILLVSSFLIPVTNTISLDEADYIASADKGFVANYFDLDGTRDLRHFHGPMVSYLIQLGFMLGEREMYVLHTLNKIIGLLAIFFIFFASLFLFGKDGKWIGLVSGFLLLTMPVYIHTHISDSATMHPITNLFSTLCFLFLSLAVIRKEKLYLYAFSAALGLMFVSMEYGFIFLCIAGLTLFIVPNPFFSLSFKSIKISKSLWISALLLIAVIAVFWNAGIFKLNLLKNFVYYLRYGAHGHPIYFRGELTYHAPWWAFIYWYWKINAIFLVFSIINLVGFIFLIIQKKFPKEYAILGVFFVVLVAALFRQHIMSPRYSLYILPYLCLINGIVFVYWMKRVPKYLKLVFGIIFTAVLLYGPLNYTPFAGDYEPFKDVAQYIQKHTEKDDKILSDYSSVLKFYLHDFDNIFNYKTGYADSLLVKDIQNYKYRFVVLTVNRLRRWPDDAAILFIRQNYRNNFTVYYNDEPRIYIYESENNNQD